MKSGKAIEAGLLDGEEKNLYEEKMANLESARAFVRETTHDRIRLDHWFRQGGNGWEKLPQEIRSKFHVELWPILEADFKYEGHIARQLAEVERFRKQEGASIPGDFDYDGISGLKAEAKVRFGKIRPRTLGQAARISGITPADVNLLMIQLEKRRRERAMKG